MLTYKEFLKESDIRVPSDVLDSIYNWFYSVMFSSLVNVVNNKGPMLSKDRFKKIEEKLRYLEILLTRKYEVSYFSDVPLQASFAVTLDQFDKRYTKNLNKHYDKSKDIVIELVYDIERLLVKMSGGTKSGAPAAVYIPDIRNLVFEPDDLFEIAGYLMSDTDLKEWKEYVNFKTTSLDGTIKHETQHMVQALTIGRVSREQIKMNSDYEDSIEGHHKSPVEFYPELTSAVSEFRAIYNDIKDKKLHTIYDKLDFIREFVGYTDAYDFHSKIYTGKRGKLLNKQKRKGQRFFLGRHFVPSGWFKVLKNEKPVAYKKAVKEFVKRIELMGLLD